MESLEIILGIITVIFIPACVFLFRQLQIVREEQEAAYAELREKLTRIEKDMIRMDALKDSLIENQKTIIQSIKELI